MSVRLGRVVEGRPYEIEFTADKKNDGVTLIYVVWVGKEQNSVDHPLIRIAAGQSRKHALDAPSESRFHGIEIRVDVPEPKGAGELKVSGLEGPNGPRTRKISVEKDTDFLIEIETKESAE